VWKAVVEGQSIDPSVILYNISDSLIVMGRLDQVDVGRVREGMPARVTLDAFPGQVLTGKVFEVRNMIWNDANNVQFYPARIALDRAPVGIRSQMSASVRLVVRREKALVVPSAAVSSRDGVRRVLVKNPKAPGGEEWRAVRTGIESGDSIQIVSGLRPGERVLVRRESYVPQDGATGSPLLQNEPTGLANPAGLRSKRRSLS
jgi:cobalt-zinc-cadmium efflux system membrane fusion protein